MADPNKNRGQDNDRALEAKTRTHIQGQQELYGDDNYTKESGADERETFSPDPNIDDTQNEQPFGEDPKDDYGLQDQFGDIDGQDPYSNLDDSDGESQETTAGVDPDPDALYGLEAPLAGPGEHNRTTSSRTDKNTRINPDEHGYNQ
ncbi:hypothetical protein KDH_21020 [Dictyobacter sp. S3.2.2.5]|uniref:Uncharacterized protein n=1 Tax=Dictyobacter halimunensis TaxID=3026934 RepID=A0ABQ6FLY0_9CHLR|nr:hypothetical protein KDH_21020 [Dictyobacter sp. S3.2.2.5]